jgi:hypothetical protein
MPSTTFVKKAGAYELAVDALLKVKLGDQYVEASNLKIKGDGAYGAFVQGDQLFLASLFANGEQGFLYDLKRGQMATPLGMLRRLPGTGITRFRQRTRSAHC